MILAAGEALVDCFGDGDAWRPRPGGAPYNWARGLARLGPRAGFAGAVGKDAFGRRLLSGLEEDGAAFLGRLVEAPTPLALVEAGGFRFYAAGTALMEPIPLPPARATLLGSLALQLGRVRWPGEGYLALDPNVRPGLTPEAFRDRFVRLAAFADLVKLSEEDARWLFGDPERALSRLSQAVPLVVLTRGARGATALLAGERIEVPPVPARTVDPTGAGDAFFAALIAGLDRRGALLPGKAPPRAIAREALADAARVAARTVEAVGALPPKPKG